MTSLVIFYYNFIVFNSVPFSAIQDFLPFLMHFLLFFLSLYYSLPCVSHSFIAAGLFCLSRLSFQFFNLPHHLLLLRLFLFLSYISSIYSQSLPLLAQLSSPKPLPVDISVSLLAVLVGFCGLALLVVSLFVFWKLCWPIWRSKALSSHSETVPQGVLPEAPAPTPHVTPSLLEHQALQAEKQKKKEEEEDQKRKVPEVMVNGRSSVKSLEAAMKISQTSPDIPAEVQQTIRERLSKKAKIQKQSTEPTSFSRYPGSTRFSHELFSVLIPIALLSSSSPQNIFQLLHNFYELLFSSASSLNLLPEIPSLQRF